MFGSASLEFSNTEQEDEFTVLQSIFPDSLKILDPHTYKIDVSINTPEQITVQFTSLKASFGVGAKKRFGGNPSNHSSTLF
jgi:hypothetical protein